MLKTSLFTLVIVAAVVFVGCVDKQNSMISLSALHDPAEAAKVPAIRVGTYDSRAIAVAYVHSGLGDNQYKAKRKEMDKAEAAGDSEKIAELKAWGEAKQHKAHLQGFCTAPVHEYIEYVKKELPGVAKAANVNVIVSKWEFDYQGRGVKTVDVTDELVKLYNPSDKTLKTIKSLCSKKPLAEEVVLKHSH